MTTLWANLLWTDVGHKVGHPYMGATITASEGLLPGFAEV